MLRVRLATRSSPSLPLFISNGSSTVKSAANPPFIVHGVTKVHDTLSIVAGSACDQNNGGAPTNGRKMDPDSYMSNKTAHEQSCKQLKTCFIDQ